MSEVDAVLNILISILFNGKVSSPIVLHFIFLLSER